MFEWLHSKVQKGPAAKQPSRGLAQPGELLEDLGQRVPRYLAEIDEGKWIYPACKRTLADAAGDVGSVWDHTRLEAMQYVMAVPGGEFALLTDAARQLDMIDSYLFQRPHENTVIDFTGTAPVDFSTAILAGLNWLTHCAELAGVPLAQQTGTLRHFRKLVTLAQRWWLTEGAIERCAQMLTHGEQAPLMLNLVWSEYTRLAKQIAAAAIFGNAIDRSAQLVALPADLVPRFEAARDPEELIQSVE